MTRRPPNQSPNTLTEANGGDGQRQSPKRTLWTARVAHFSFKSDFPPCDFDRDPGQIKLGVLTLHLPHAASQRSLANQSACNRLCGRGKFCPLHISRSV